MILKTSWLCALRATPESLLSQETDGTIGKRKATLESDLVKQLFNIWNLKIV